MRVDIDPVARLCACREWVEAEAAARSELAAVRGNPESHPLTRARAVRGVADVLLEAQRPEEATELVFEARRLYRPFLGDPGCVAEIQLTLANQAFLTARSREAEGALELALRASESEPRHRLLFARALRFQAHLAVLRWELREGVALLERALGQVAADDGPSLLLRLQYLFSLAEVHVALGERARVPEIVGAALDLLESKLGGEGDLVAHGRRRAEVIRAVIDDSEVNRG